MFPHMLLGGGWFSSRVSERRPYGHLKTTYVFIISFKVFNSLILAGLGLLCCEGFL